MWSGRDRRAGQNGAVLVHVAIALMGLLAFSALAVDYGIMWASRRQAQNAADAAALAGAGSLAWDDPNDFSRAQDTAAAAGTANRVWGAAPVITPGSDVTFPSCPASAPGLPDTCVRANVFRNQARGNPLPTFFARLVGVNGQGVRATATAQVATGNLIRCMRPWAIPDKWYDVVDNTNPKDVNNWTMEDEYERRVQNGKNKGQLLDPGGAPPQRDAYIPYGSTDPDGLGRAPSTFDPAVDIGRQITLKEGNPQQTLTAGWYYPIDLPIPGSPDTGGNRYRKNIESCNSTPVHVGDVIVNEPGGMQGPTNAGVANLVAQDSGAYWDTGCNCVMGSAFPVSPRIVPVPVFSPEDFDTQSKQNGRLTLQIVKIVGMFVEPMQGNDVIGRMMPYPAELQGNGGNVNDPSSFLRTVILVR